MTTNLDPKSFSRLDQLFTLLENGTTNATRSAAAKQLGIVQKKHPHELSNLMDRLLVYVRHKDWDTRIAAAEAIKAVVSEVPQWRPAIASEILSDAKKTEPHPSTKLKISNMNIKSIIEESEVLLCSWGEEFEFRESDKDSLDKLTRARQRIEKKMGLTIGGCGSLGISSKDLFNDEDLLDNTGKCNSALGKVKRKPDSIRGDAVSQVTKGMSSREKNRVKRKVKMQFKENSVELSPQGAAQEDDGQPAKKKKEDGGASMRDVNQQNSDNKWPFESICEDLLALLFSPVWEWRHGACLALRNILNIHATGAGLVAGRTADELDHDHGIWLEDAAVRMLCVMALDRFGDFVSDQLIAPVRESCAQALSVVVKFLSIKTVSDVLAVLVTMTMQTNWEVRHAGFLGIKYVLAVRTDLRESNINECIQPLLSGLCDKDGDIQSVCADALIPITAQLIKMKNRDLVLQRLINVLSDSLRDMDELTASTKSLLELFSKIILSLPQCDIMSLLDVQCVMSRLRIFTKHPSLSVKKAALQTLSAILSKLETIIITWFLDIAVESLWSLVECCIFESDSRVQEMTVKVWESFCEKTPSQALCRFCTHYFGNILSMAAQPDNVPYPQSLLRDSSMSTAQQDGNESSMRYIGGAPTLRMEDDESRSEAVVRTRWNVSKMCGVMCGYMGCYQNAHTVTDLLLFKLQSRCSSDRIVGCMVLSAWWQCRVSMPPQMAFSSLMSALNDELYFSEISALFFQVQTEMRSVFQVASQTLKKPLNSQVKQVYSLEDAFQMHSELETHLKESEFPTLMECSKRLYSIAKEAQENNDAMQRVVHSYLILSLAVGSYSATDSHLSVLNLPKITPIIRPLMDGLKNEVNKVHRDTIAQSLTYLIDIYRARDPCPNPKLIRNICLLLHSDEMSPNVLDPVATVHTDILQHCKCSRPESTHSAILTLLRKQAMTLQAIDQRKRNGDGGRGAFLMPGMNADNRVAQAGATAFFRRICEHFKTGIFEALPELWNIISKLMMVENLSNSNRQCHDGNLNTDMLEGKMMSLVVLEALIPILGEDLIQTKVMELLPFISQLLFCQYSAVRYVCSRCFSILTKRIPYKLMEKFVLEILPYIDSSDLCKRMGVVETTSNIIDCLESAILPFSVLLIVPLLGRMSDQNHQIRLVATRCFASLMQYLPVESSIPTSPELSDELNEKRKQDRRFLEQLLDTKTLDEYPVAVPIKATLRPYQKDGVKWIAFLRRYKLHGILCDDMGLGKTLQTICILASCQNPIKDEHLFEKPLPSLVICPPTVTGHWMEEVEKFCDKMYLDPLHYVGTPTERAKLQSRLPNHNLVIASYEVLRNDISFFNKHCWNYCILDEGHMIRNAKNKLSACVKSLKASNRLILTGTPIQNNVLELWSLFDFLMPGFLGTEQEFNFYFGKPILASRDAKSSSKEQEEGVLAMESLHKQVLPFMLRRMKEDVLHDLPPKIIQDYYCALTPLQVRLYEDFSKTKAKRDLESSIIRAEMDQTRSSQTCHVFQAMQYLQKVCNHPALVLSTCHPEYKQIRNELKSDNTSLHDIQHSAKLIALQQLLNDCGIGVPSHDFTSPLASQHRALIFCQHKSMLDIVEHDLLRKHMATVTFLRLDGSVPANCRHSIVSKFNNDASIDLLLLTTKVGGLGLNLTGADVVIFIEHDWNPTVDMQAMDRAHRIGQKRAVNVYRLITRGTLEEKIMSLQRFKMDVASTIVTADNSNLISMGTNQLLDLFTINRNSKKEVKSKLKDKSGKGFRALLEDLGDLWDQNQYDTEYNLDSFIEKLIV